MKTRIEKATSATMAWVDLFGLAVKGDEDLNECLKQLAKNNNQFWRRTLYRIGFAEIEGRVNATKTYLLHWCLEEDTVNLPPETQLFLDDSASIVKESGTVTTRSSFTKMSISIKATMKLYQKHMTRSHKVDFLNGWDELLKAIEVRNRLTHPRNLYDLEVSDEEVMFFMKGQGWFRDELCKIFNSAADYADEKNKNNQR